MLDQANICTDTIGSMIDRHNYAGGGAGGHGIAGGQIFADSHLGKPGADLFSIGLKQVQHQPFSISEWTMCPPNQWSGSHPGAGGTPQDVFARARVVIGFGKDDPPAAGPAPGADRPGNVIAAAGQQLIWDQGRERILIQTERTQGVVGKGGVIQLAAAGRGPLVTRLDIKTPFVSLLLTPLDDLPLAQSTHVLITALARDRRTGARYSLDGKSLLAAGTAPLLLEPVQATIKLAGPPPISIRPLDPYGVPKKETLGAGKDGSFQIDGRSRAYYYEVRR